MKNKSLLLAIASLFAAGVAFAAANAPAAKAGGCCTKASKDGKACAHPCCVDAAKKGDNCTKCGGAGKIADNAAAKKK